MQLKCKNSVFHLRFIWQNFRSGYSRTPSYTYGDAHKCRKPCDCSACCCDHRKDILCDLLQIFLMILIIKLSICAIILSPPFIPGRRRRRRRALEGLSNSLQIIPNTEKLKDTPSIVYKAVLGLVTNFLDNDGSISKIGFDTPWSANEVNYNREAYDREPRNYIFFGDDDNDPPIPDLCKKKCCLKCCKKDKILCIIQVILLIITIILLVILNILLLIPGFGRKRRRRSVSGQHSLWIKSLDNVDGYNYMNYNSTCGQGTNDTYDIESLDEIAQNIKDALSSVVRSRNLSIDLKHMPNKCLTCIQWSIFDLGHEYGPFVVHSAIPRMLHPLIL